MHKKIPSHIFLPLLLGLALISPLSKGNNILITQAEAQVAPIAPEPRQQDDEELKDTRAFTKLRKSLTPTEARNPEGALAQYRQFVAARPDIDPPAAVLANHAIAQVQFRQLQDVEGAVATYNAAIAKYPKERSTTGLITEKARLLLVQDKVEEAAQLLLEQLPQVEKSESQKADPTYAGPMLYQLCVALTRQNRKEQVVTLLEDAFKTLPVLLDDGQQGRVDSILPGQSVPSTGWMYGLLSDLLQEQGHKDQALGWAKIRWMTCNFEDADIGRAARLLAKTWKSTEPSGTGLLSFVAFQKGKSPPVVPASAKSYERIIPPIFDDKALQEQLAALQDGKGKTFPGQSDAKINIHILLGQWNEAMSESCFYLLARPSAKARVQQVARVFKAADGNLDRANAFVTFFLNGTGPNPLVDFFKQYAQRATVSPTPLVAAGTLVEDVTAKAGQRKPGSPFAAPVPVAAVTVPLLAIQIAQPAPGQTSADAEGLYKTGLLLPEDALYSLTRGGVDSELLTENHDVKARLAGIIVRHGQELGDVPGLREPRVRLSIGDYYRDQKDTSHAIDVYQSLVDQGHRLPVGQETPPEGRTNGGRRAWYYQVSVERLAAIYSGLKDNAHFEQLWTQERQQAAPGSEMYNTATLVLARHYAATGQKENAKTAYAQAAAGSGWTAIAAVWDQAVALIDQRQYEAALQLLTPSLEATKEQNAEDSQDDAGRNPRLARMGLLVQASFCHYKLGDRESALRLSREALAIYQTARITANLGVEGQANKARAIVDWSEKWQKAPLISDPPTLSFKATVGQTRLNNPVPLYVPMRVRSPQTVEIQAKCEDPQIKLEISDQVQKKEFFSERRIELCIPASAFVRGLNTFIVVTTQTPAGPQELRIPLAVLAAPTRRPVAK